MKASSDRCAHVRTVRALVLIVALLALTAFARGQTILYVDDNAPDGGDGLSWETAFNDLQDALDVKPGEGTIEVRVGQGRYVPSLRTDPKDPRTATFQLANKTAIIGGFAGYGEADPDERDLEKYFSTLSGDLNNNDQPNFVNYQENVYHVLTGNGVDNTAALDGCVVRSGNAGGSGWPDYYSAGGGIINLAARPSILKCTFAVNRARYGGAAHQFEESAASYANCKFSGNFAIRDGGALYSMNVNTSVEGCVFEENASDHRGGAIHYEDTPSVSVLNCAFRSNFSEVGGGISIKGDALPHTVILDGCTFIGNEASVGAGAAQLVASETGVVKRCSFSKNYGGTIAGAFTATSATGINWLIDNCDFIQNETDWIGGGVVLGTPSTIVNCMFSRNAALDGGAIVCTTIAAVTLIVNCTLANNIGSGAYISAQDATIANSVLWGNTPYQVGSGSAQNNNCLVTFSNIQNGWSGPGSDNIDADPLFIQPGCDNLRLGVGSPCIDAGDNSAIPSGITTDLDGNSRIINAIVDMGAYEGEHEMLPQAACADDIDKGEAVNLTPEGGPFNPLLKPAATLINNSAENDAYATVTQIENQLHPGSGGFNEMGSKLQVETSLVPGAFFMRVFIDFDAEQLSGFDPISLDLTQFDSNSGTYELAAASNIQSSPGHRGPLGDRQVIIGTSWQGQISFDVGDYGVFWNPDLQRGFAWANVDHASDFAFGVPLPQCVGDCTFPSNGVVNLDDLTLVLDNWGTPPAGPDGFTDITNNGLVDVDDLLAVIHAWGNCP